MKYTKEELLGMMPKSINGVLGITKMHEEIASALAGKLQKPVVLREDEIENIILDNEDFPEVAAKEIHAVLAGKIQKPEAFSSDDIYRMLNRRIDVLRVGLHADITAAMKKKTT